MEITNNERIEKFLEQKVEQIQKEQTKNIKNSKRKRKGLTQTIIAVVLAASALLTATFLTRKQNNSKNNKPTQSTVDTTLTINPADRISINGLGLVYDNPVAQNSQYGNTTGNVDANQIVESNGTIWVDQNAANNENNIGNSQFDNQNGTLQEGADGNIYDVNTGYEVEDSNGNVVDEGVNESGIPEGYAWDPVLGRYVLEEDVGRYVYVDATYYDANGHVVFVAGEIVTVETLELIQATFTTTPPTNVPSTQPQETQPQETQPTEGVINPDGTYTIYGITYMSREDYEQFLLHPEQYGYYNGMILSLDYIESLSKENQKTR